MQFLMRIVSPFLRVGQIAFAAVVAGIIGHYLDSSPSPPTHPVRVYARWIYSIIVAGVSILLALLWLIPLSSSFYTYPIDLLLSLAWLAAFGLFVTYNRSSVSSCGSAAGSASGSAFNWGGLTGGGLCNRFRAAQAFSFLSAIFWLASTMLGVWFIQGERVKRKWQEKRASSAGNTGLGLGGAGAGKSKRSGGFSLRELGLRK